MPRLVHWHRVYVAWYIRQSFCPMGSRRTSMLTLEFGRECYERSAFPDFLLTRPSLSISMAEIATINLVTCFPIMPRFVQLVLNKGSKTDKGVKGPTPRRTGSQSKSHLINSSEAWIRRGEDVTAPWSAYIPLAAGQDCERPSRGWGGIQRTVSIELTSRV